MGTVRRADVIVIGAGAAGLMCAIAAGRRGRRVVVLEKGDRIGRKILISGGGRCNFTNLKVAASNFISRNPHFCKSALARFTPADFIALVERHGIAYHEKKLGQLFCDGSAKEIVAMLKSECDAAGVEIITGCDVSGVEKRDLFAVATSSGSFEADSLVIATGGLTVPKIATDFGFRVARQFGVAVTSLMPALVPFSLSGDGWEALAALSGVSIDAIVTCGTASFRENILFTHKGLSGPAILQISSHWKPGERVFLNLTPHGPIEDELLRAKRRGDKTELKNFLARTFPRSFAEFFCGRYVPSKPLNQCADKDLENLAALLAHWEITPSGTLGYEKAEVTLGGIDTDALSSKTMETKNVPGLHFIGEVVDVTGWLGGYNFQWAWASGYAAGTSA